MCMWFRLRMMIKKDEQLQTVKYYVGKFLCVVKPADFAEKERWGLISDL